MQIRNKMYVLLFVALFGLQQGMLGMKEIGDENGETFYKEDVINNKSNDDDIDELNQDYNKDNLSIDQKKEEKTVGFFEGCKQRICGESVRTLAFLGLVFGFPAQGIYGLSEFVWKTGTLIDQKLIKCQDDTEYEKTVKARYCKIPGYTKFHNAKRIAHKTLAGNNPASYRTKLVNFGSKSLNIGVTATFFGLLSILALKNEKIRNVLAKLPQNPGAKIAYGLDDMFKIIYAGYKKFANAVLINPKFNSFI